MNDSEKLTVKQSSSTYWVVQSGSVELAGALTREAAEAERELTRRLRLRAAKMRSTAPRRPPLAASRAR